MKKISFILICIPLFSLTAENRKIKESYRKVFPQINSLKGKVVDDPISEKPVNKEILVAIDKNKKILGFIREVKTSTGCKSACLPVIFTLFYDAKKSYLKLYSEPGLTKKNHRKFSADDYFKLDEILRRNPKGFKAVTHPYDLVDIVTSATKVEYSSDVVKEAAYSSLRINLYNQQTLKALGALK